MTFGSKKVRLRAMKPTLYLMLGYPGAGKTTTAEVVAKLTGATLLSSDKIRLELFPEPTFSEAEHTQLYAALNKQTEELLQQGKSVIYDANLNRYQHRQEKYEICQRTGSEPVLLWVQTQKTIAKERAMHENRAHLVPKNETAGDMFERIATIIEPPRDNEPAVIVDGTKVTEDYLHSLLFNK